jgi:hypothetical protein
VWASLTDLDVEPVRTFSHCFDAPQLQRLAMCATWPMWRHVLCQVAQRLQECWFRSSSLAAASTDLADDIFDTKDERSVDVRHNNDDDLPDRFPALTWLRASLTFPELARLWRRAPNLKNVH